MNIRDQIYKNTEYQRGVLTGAAEAYLIAVASKVDLVPFKTDLTRVVKNALQLQGSTYTQEELLAKLIVFCNEGYLPQL